jgi:hypothetical protein
MSSTQNSHIKIRIPTLIKDPVTTAFLEMETFEPVTINREDFFLDGPISRRVAILDFDQDTGSLLPGAPYKPLSKGRFDGEYVIADTNDVHARDFNQVSVFGNILTTMYMFEDKDVLGRNLTWGFDTPQLLVVPRAGEWANAFYERESNSLQFFFFRSSHKPDQIIYTSLSRDIVTHETGHAILDGIAPDLYNALSPQSLALHEAVADLTSVVMAFRCEPLAKKVLEKEEGSIRSSSAFSGIAEQFASERDPRGRSVFLRNLLNQKTLTPGFEDSVTRNEPHALSEVLSGALYRVILEIYESRKSRYSEEKKLTEAQIPFRSLLDGTRHFKRMIFRALDYLPPGEVSFADYGRAIIAADQASHPQDTHERDLICEEFVKRGIVRSADELKVETNFEHPAVTGMDLETLIESEWAAYEFANNNRDFLSIPKGVHFQVRPRLDTTKLYYHLGGRQEIRECIFKVSWDQKEANQLGSFYPSERRITVGTTLAIDWSTHSVRAKLTSDYHDEQQREDRDLLLQRLNDEGVLRKGNLALGPDGKLLRSAVKAETIEGLMRVRGASRMLHIV